MLLEASSGTKMSKQLLDGDGYILKFFGDFSWEGGGALPQNSLSVQLLARSFGTDRKTNKQTDKHHVTLL